MLYHVEQKTNNGWLTVYSNLTDENKASAILASYRIRFPENIYRLFETDMTELEAQCDDYGVGK